jgi:hypothetical protein
VEDGGVVVGEAPGAGVQVEVAAFVEFADLFGPGGLLGRVAAADGEAATPGARVREAATPGARDVPGAGVQVEVAAFVESADLFGPGGLLDRVAAADGEAATPGARVR